MAEKMTMDEKQSFDDLCLYVKKILGYTDDMKLSKQQVLRLKGMSKGQFIINNKQKQNAQYSFNTIKLTFMFSKLAINKALSTKNFPNEMAKFNYIMAIVDGNLNEVSLRLKAKEKAEKEAEKQINKLKIDINTTTKTTNGKNINNVVNVDDNSRSKLNDLTKGMW